MKDTPDHINKKQLEIWLAKPVSERFRIGFSAMDDIHKQIESRIMKQNPTFSAGELRAEFIRQLYKDEFSPRYLEDVLRWVKEKYKALNTSTPPTDQASSR